MEHAFRVVRQTRPLNFLGAHRDGLFTVQDKASVLAGLVTAPEPGMTVLDVCAAPGGQTGHFAQMMGGWGRIHSLDFSERRLGAWRREIERLGVGNAVPVLGDARRPGDLPDVEADLVLVDPPLHGHGDLQPDPQREVAPHEEINRQDGSIQRRILDNCAG